MSQVTIVELQELQQCYTEFIDEFKGFKDNMASKLQRIEEVRSTLVDDLHSQYTKLRSEKAQFEKDMTNFKEQQENKMKEERDTLMYDRNILDQEKDAWEKELERIQKIQPIDEIIDLNVGGKDDFCVRKSTLCYPQGSALEALFSGRHQLQKKNDKIFIDRNPQAFNLMLDFIRNSGQLHEQQKQNEDMLHMELRYWGIDTDLFREQTPNRFEIIQKIFDRPIDDFFERREGKEFFFKTIEENKFDFKKLHDLNKFKFKDKFEILNIIEIIDIAYGEEMEERALLLKDQIKDPVSQEYQIGMGEMVMKDGDKMLYGYGRVIRDNQFAEGQFRKGLLHGQAKIVDSSGIIAEGRFEKNMLNGQGQITYPDGKMEQGSFKNNKLHGQAKRIQSDGQVQEGRFEEDNLMVE